jgi:hypothetical protein
VRSVAKLKFSAVFPVEEVFNEVTVEQIGGVDIHNKTKQHEN